MADEISWLPSVDDVAAHCQARLKERGGGVATTFTEKTHPTAAQVALLITSSGRTVRSRVGDPCTDELKEDSGAVTALRAAMLVESTYYPEQTRNEGSSFNSLYKLYKDDLKALTEAVGEICGGGGGDSAAGGGARPRATFDDLPLIGRSSPDW